MPNNPSSLHIVGSRQLGGAEHFCLRLVRALNETGHPVSVIHRPGSPMADALADDVIEHIPVALANIWDAWSLWRIRQIIAAQQPAIVQTYMGRATRLTRLPRNCPSVHIARLGGFYKIDGYYRHAHAWVGNTQAICDYMVREGLPADKVFQIGNFVPAPVLLDAEQKKQVRAQLGIPDEAWVLFALGRFVEKKGFQDLLQAVASLPETLAGRPIHLMIAGDGAERKNLLAAAATLNLGQRLHWLGWQNAPNDFFEIANVFICPSRHEPFGVVQLEAWNHHLPLVTTATDGALELVTPEEDALLCPVNDTTAMAGRIRSVLEASEAERKTMGEKGYATLQQRFGRAAIVQRYSDLYSQLTAA